MIFFFWDVIVLGAILVSGRVSNFNKRSPASEMEQSLVVSFIVMNPRLCACSMPSKRQKDSPKWCDLPWCKVKTTLNRSENSWWNSLKFMVMNHHQDRNRIKQSQQIQVGHSDIRSFKIPSSPISTSQTHPREIYEDISKRNSGRFCGWILVGGFNPSEKYTQIESVTQILRVTNKKIFMKPPPTPPPQNKPTVPPWKIGRLTHPCLPVLFLNNCLLSSDDMHLCGFLSSRPDEVQGNNPSTKKAIDSTEWAETRRVSEKKTGNLLNQQKRSY